MFTLYAHVSGTAAFFVATVVLGGAIRRNPSQAGSHRLSRISHAFFWVAFLAPAYVGLVFPGLTHFDELPYGADFSVPNCACPDVRAS